MTDTQKTHVLRPDHKATAQDWLRELTNDVSGRRLPDTNESIEDSEKIEDLIDSGCVIQWRRFDEDDPQTWPRYGATVLGLIVWSHGKNARYGSMLRPEESREAKFYEAEIGVYILRRSEDGDLEHHFLRHHIDDEDAYEGLADILPKWWTYIATPQSVELE